MTSPDQTADRTRDVIIDIVQGITPDNFYHHREIGDLANWCERLRFRLAGEIETLRRDMAANINARNDFAGDWQKAHERADAAEAALAAAQAENARLREAALHISPYLRWTVSEESPGHHPTMPSAVAAFQTAFDLDTAEKRLAATRAALSADMPAGGGEPVAPAPAPDWEKAVEALADWVRDDVLPAFGISPKVYFHDPELAESCRTALRAAAPHLGVREG